MDSFEKKTRCFLIADKFRVSLKKNGLDRKWLPASSFSGMENCNTTIKINVKPSRTHEFYIPKNDEIRRILNNGFKIDSRTRDRKFKVQMSRILSRN